MIKTHADPNLSDAQSAALEQGPRSLHAAVKDILPRCHPKALFESTKKVKATQPRGRRQFGQGNRLVQVFLYVRLNRANLPRSEPRAGL